MYGFGVCSVLLVDSYSSSAACVSASCGTSTTTTTTAAPSWYLYTGGVACLSPGVCAMTSPGGGCTEAAGPYVSCLACKAANAGAAGAC